VLLVPLTLVGLGYLWAMGLSLGEMAERDARFAPLWCEMLHRQGRDREALQRAELAMRQSPNDPVPHLVVGTVLRAMGRNREALERIHASAKLGGGGPADFELGMIAWQAGMEDEASRRFVASLKDPQLGKNRRRTVQLYLSRLRGRDLAVRNESPLVIYLRSQLTSRSASTGEAFRRIHLATCGITRMFSVAAGTAGLQPLEGEMDRLRAIDYEDDVQLEDTKALAELRAEFDRSVRSCAKAVRRLASRRAEREIAEAEAAYARGSQAARRPYEALAAAARAQVQMVACLLRHHPRSAELAPALDSAIWRMKVRRSLA
jgi:hypothetical protein